MATAWAGFIPRPGFGLGIVGAIPRPLSFQKWLLYVLVCNVAVGLVGVAAEVAAGCRPGQDTYAATVLNGYWAAAKRAGEDYRARYIVGFDVMDSDVGISVGAGCTSPRSEGPGGRPAAGGIREA